MCEECAWESALDNISHARDLLNDLRDHRSDDRAQDFADSVEERLDGFAEWIETNEHVTPKQEEAIDNIIAGIGRWLD
ncbi:MAG: hypothetical protein JXC32_20995 [Anaerolineae bacterium]|nr:hypothetical protein [Anaerolineae bacterium]